MSNQRLFLTDSSGWDLDERFWPEKEGMPFVFIKRITLPDLLPEGFELFNGARLYLFGRREPETHGYRIRFSVLELRKDSTAPIIHELAQGSTGHRDGIFFSSQRAHETSIEGQQPSLRPEILEFSRAVTKAIKTHVGVFETQPQYKEPLFAAYERAGKPTPAARWIKPLVKRDYPWALHRPRWVEGNEGDWPFLKARPMLYVDQVFLRESAVAREYLTWDTMLYLFIGCDEGLSEVKIYQQHTNEQTAEDHYQTEELIGEYLKNPDDADVIKKCVEHRDKYLHRFLLEQPNLSADALKLLAAKSYNKSIRDEAAKRLKGM